MTDRRVAPEGSLKQGLPDVSSPHLVPQHPLRPATAVVGVGRVQDEQHQEVNDLGGETTRILQD